MAIVPRLTEKELNVFVPLHDWVVIKKNQVATHTASGIILPEDTKNYQCKNGTIHKIGSFSNLKAHKLPIPNIKVGDEVMFNAFAGMETPMPEGYLIMRSHEILGVVSK